VSLIKNNKGFTIMESLMMGAIGFLIIGAAIAGIAWIKSSFSRLSKRSIAIEIVSSFTQNLQDQFYRYPNITIRGKSATYVMCFDSSIRPARNSSDGMDPVVKVLSGAKSKRNTGDCVAMGYEVHLSSTSTPNEFRLVVIGVANNLGPLYDETITVFKQ
jgi:hypothetical protein